MVFLVLSTASNMCSIMSDPRGILSGMSEPLKFLISEAYGVLERLDTVAATGSAGVLGDREVQEELAEEFGSAVQLMQKAELITSRIAALLAAQCDPVLGITAMNARFGAHRDVSGMLSDLGKLPKPEADRLVRNGRMLTASARLAEAKATDSHVDKQTQHNAGLLPVAEALQSGKITPAQANELGKALTQPDTNLTQEHQHELAAKLVNDAPEMELGTLRRYAQTTVLNTTPKTPLEHELALRAKRYLTLGTVEDGLYPLRGMLDAESAALVKSVFDQATNPNHSDIKDSDPAEYENRTPGQRRVDALIGYLKAGIDADPTVMFTGKRPTVSVIVRHEDLKAQAATYHVGGTDPAGLAWFSGVEVPVSAQTAKRYLCDSGMQTVTIDTTGTVLDLGRDSRTFTPTQKRALIARDGGCLWPGCERPPSWCEAHHILPWEHGGDTNLENGVLLCRRHHMALHNHGFTIRPAPLTGDPPDDCVNAQPPAALAQCPLQLSPPDSRGTSPPQQEHKVLPVLFMLHPPPGHPRYRAVVPMPSKAAWLTCTAHSRRAPIAEHLAMNTSSG